MAEPILSTPEADQLLSRYAANFDSPQDMLETLALLVDKYSKISTTNASAQNKAVVAANKAMIDRLKAQASLSKSLTDHIAKLNSDDATVKAAALSAIARQASTITATLSKLEAQESVEMHPWYEKAKAEAISAQGGLTGPAFWGNLIATVTKTGAVSQIGLNSTWLVQNLNSKIEKGEISDWRKQPGISAETKKELENLWFAADEAMTSRGLTKAAVTNLGNSVYASADGAASVSTEAVNQAIRDFGPAISRVNSLIVGNVNADDIALEAKKLVDEATSSQSQEVQLAFGDMLLDFFAKAGADASKSSGMFPFSVEKTAAWKGALVTDPTFLTWAEENGYESIGKPMYDEKGKIIGMVPGADDTRAIKAYGRATLHAGNPERSGYGEKTVQIMEKPGATGIRYGTAKDAEGNEVPIVQVTLNGKAQMFQGVRSTLGAASSDDVGNDKPFDIKDFIPVRMSNIEEGTLTFRDEAPTYYKEVQGLSPALAARKFYNEFNAGKPPVATEVDEPKIPPMPDIPKIQFGTVKIGNTDVNAISVVHRGATSIYYAPSDDQSYRQFSGSPGQFSPASDADTYTIDPTKVPIDDASVAEFIMQNIGANTEGMFFAYEDVKKEYEDKVASIKKAHEEEIKANPPKSLTKFDPTKEELSTSGEPIIGIDYGISPLTGKRVIKMKDGSFSQVDGTLVKPVTPEEKGPSADDRLQFSRAEKEAKKAGVIEPPVDVKDGLKEKRLGTTAERPPLPDETQVNALGDRPNKVTPILDDEDKDATAAFFTAMQNLEAKLIDATGIDGTARQSLMSTYEALIPRALAAGYVSPTAKGNAELAKVDERISAIAGKPASTWTQEEKQEFSTLVGTRLTLTSNRGATAPNVRAVATFFDGSKTPNLPVIATTPGKAGEPGVPNAGTYNKDERQAIASKQKAARDVLGASTKQNMPLVTDPILSRGGSMISPFSDAANIPPKATQPSATIQPEPKKGRLRQIFSKLSPTRSRPTTTPAEVNTTSTP